MFHPYQIGALCLSFNLSMNNSGYRSVLLDLFELASPSPIRVWRDVGQHEYYIGPNRRVAELLRGRGYDVIGEGKHDYRLTVRAG